MLEAEGDESSGRNEMKVNQIPEGIDKHYFPFKALPKRKKPKLAEESTIVQIKTTDSLSGQPADKSSLAKIKLKANKSEEHSFSNTYQKLGTDHSQDMSRTKHILELSVKSRSVSGYSQVKSRVYETKSRDSSFDSTTKAYKLAKNSQEVRVTTKKGDIMNKTTHK